MKTWYVCIGQLLVQLSDKGVARELCRAFEGGVFWEDDPEQPQHRPIFVGHARAAIQAAGTTIYYDPSRFTIKEDDVLFAAQCRRNPEHVLEMLRERELLLSVRRV